MKREEKNLLSRQKILSGAMKEFGAKSYAQASLNAICAQNGISKGIVYHYFKDKDELYLTCLEECFNALTDYLKNASVAQSEGIDSALGAYFDARTAFFEENPAYMTLFTGAIMAPPEHLSAQIERIRSPFDELNRTVLTKLLEGVRLRADVDVDDVVNGFGQYQDFVNAQYRMKHDSEADLREHEKRCSMAVSVLLYGVIVRED